MPNRISRLFQDKPTGILSVFYTAGFPSLHDAVPIAIALENAGVDMIELGIPFSDPVADGPVIQASSKVALDNGMNLGLLISQLKEIRKSVKIPIILMGYVNPVMQYGFERFCKDASEAGADGLILPDLPLEVFESRYRSFTEAAGLINVFLVSPTTSEDRIRRIDACSSGFIYAVSSSSTTGARTGFSEEQVSYFRRLAGMKLKNPMVIGFGISNHETFSAACDHAAGAIVGSAFINFLGNTPDGIEAIPQFIDRLRKGN